MTFKPFTSRFTPSQPFSGKTAVSGYQFLNRLRNDINQIIACMGTSLTSHAQGLENFPYPTQLSWWLKTIAANPSNVTVLNHGKSGKNSQYGVDTQLDITNAANPDVVFIEYAINDAVFTGVPAVDLDLAESEANLNTIIDSLRATNPDVEIILMTMSKPTGSWATSRPDIDDYYQIVRTVATERNFLLVDNVITWNDLHANDNDTWVAHDYDGLHCKPGGNLEVTIENIKAALNEATFNPANYGSNVLWLNGTKPTSQFVDTGAVAQVKTDGDILARWNDGSSGGEVASQGTAANQPTYQSDTTTSVNGLPVALFDGNDYLDLGVEVLGNTTLFADDTEEFTVFAVGVVNAIAGTLISRCTISGIERGFQIWAGDTGVFVNTLGVNNDIASGADLRGQTILVTVTWDGSSAKGYLNDGNAVPLTLGSATRLQNSGQRVLLGARSNGAFAALTGKVCDTIVFDKFLNDTKRMPVAKELMYKYGILA